MTEKRIRWPLSRRSSLLAVIFGTLVALMFSAMPAHAATSDGLPWGNPGGYPTSVRSSSIPSVVSTNSGEIAVWRADGSGVQPLWYSVNEGAPVRLPEGATSESSPVVLSWDGTPTVFHVATGPNNHRVLLSQFIGGSWGPWSALPSSVLTPSTPAVTIAGNGDLIMAWRGTDNHIYMGGFFDNGSQNFWRGLGEVPGGGLTEHNPTLTTLPDHVGILIAHTGTNGGSNVFYQEGFVDFADINNPVMDWNGSWLNVPGAPHTSGPPSVASAGSRLRLAVLDGANDIQYNAATVQDGAAFWGNTWFSQTNIALIAAAALYLGRDGNVWAAAFARSSHLFFEKRLQ